MELLRLLMIPNSETGGLFRMASKLMQAEATKNADVRIDKLMTLLGRYYQIRDDYQDMTQLEANLDTYCDLDQGAFTLPIIHALIYQQEHNSTELLSILQARRNAGGLSLDSKKHFLSKLKEYGSLEYTRSVLTELHGDLINELDSVEKETGIKNWILRLLFFRLKM
jgi:geranylgeranyl pyrophosphate synthase